MSRLPASVILCLLVASATTAQLSVVETCTAVGSLPHASVLANMDGATGLDVVVVNEGAGTIQVLLNDGLGGLTAGAPITVGTTPRGICAADFDGDGNMDVAVANAGSGTVSVVYGDGSGGAALVLGVATGGVPVDVAAVVRSGDTVPDVVVADQGTFFTSGALLIADNDANGTPLVRTFGAVTTLVSGGAFESVAAGDATAGAAPDVVAANSDTGTSGGVHILDGDASLAAIGGSPFAAGSYPVHVALADLNGDSKLDPIVSASGFLGTGGLRVLETPAFTANVITTTPAVSATGGANLDADVKGDLAMIPALGDVVVFLGYNAGAAPDSTSTLTGIAGFDIVHGQLSPAGSGGPPLCDRDELSIVKKASDQLCSVRMKASAATSAVASTGCTGGTSVCGTSGGSATIGNASFAITLTGATAFRYALLLAQEHASPGSPPTVFTIGSCGYAIDTGAPYLQASAFTNASGAASFSAALPSSLLLVCREFLFEWAVFDGGPVGGLITLSPALLVRIGEP